MGPVARSMGLSIGKGRAFSPNRSVGKGSGSVYTKTACLPVTLQLDKGHGAGSILLTAAGFGFDLCCKSALGSAPGPGGLLSDGWHREAGAEGSLPVGPA